MQQDARVIAVLGMLGGFLTPVLCPTGQDNPFGLFSYIALLDLGVLAVSGKKKWAALPGLAAAGTILMQWGWSFRFFGSSHYAEGAATWIPILVFTGFGVLFAAAAGWMGWAMEGAALCWLFRRVPHPGLRGLGAALLTVAFEIADVFTPAGSRSIAFDFQGNFGRDMTYTIAWSLFALGLLMAGFWKRLAPVRYAGIGLLAIALLKLFLHDLDNIGSGYRIGAFMIVAVIALAASFLYQRFQTETKPATAPPRSASPESAAGPPPAENPPEDPPIQSCIHPGNL